MEIVILNSIFLNQNMRYTFFKRMPLWEFVDIFSETVSDKIEANNFTILRFLLYFTHSG